MKRLYKSRKDKMIDGVCGGVAKYLEIDPTIVRLIWTLLVLVNGIGLILYLIAMIVIPREPLETVSESTDQSQSPQTNSIAEESDKADKSRLLMAVIVIAIGLVLLASSFTSFILSPFFWKAFIGTLLVAGGGYLLYKLVKEGE